jgi:hypothetical protein
VPYNLLNRTSNCCSHLAAAQNDNNGNTGIPGWMEYSIGIPCIAINFTGLLLLIPGGIIPKYFSLTISEEELINKYRKRNTDFGISR